MYPWSKLLRWHLDNCSINFYMGFGHFAWGLRSVLHQLNQNVSQRSQLKRHLALRRFVQRAIALLGIISQLKGST